MSRNDARTIYKYSIALEQLRTRIDIDMPAGAEILDVQLQGNVPTMWALVVPNRPTVARRFHIVGTGNPVPGGRYVGTWQQQGFVFHLFDAGAVQ